MADSSVTTPAPAPATLKKAKASNKPRVKASHPPTSEMVGSAIKSLKERGGSSLQAIKKYISTNYKVDAEKLAPFIKKYLKSAVASGELVQTKGKGASGSFKLPSSKPEKASVPRAAAKKPKAAAAKTKKATPKAQKKTVAKKTPVKKQAPAPKPKKTPSKAKKAAKGPTKKPKAPKPKKAVKSKAAKKESPRK